MKTLILSICILCIGLVIIGGCTSTTSQSSTISTITNSPSDIVTPAAQTNYHDLSLIALKISDFPDGWQVQKEPTVKPDSYDSQFSTTQPGVVDVIQHIQQYSTIEEAEISYNQDKAKITDYKIDQVNLGDAGYGYIISGDSAYVVFRSGNIITTIRYYGSFGETLSINDAQQYASIIAARI